jgi:SAM-dependent methyltransferase
MSGERGRWESLARDPYFAVVNKERYRDAGSREDARRDFFESGESDVAATFEVLASLAGARTFRHALDYGCGVGRLTIPLSSRCERVTGADISEAMLAEARRNATEMGADNTCFVRSDQLFAGEGAGRFDLIHSYIVFQHIAPRVGLEITRNLLGRLEPGGFGALHYTFARMAPLGRRMVNRLRRWIPPINAAVNLVQRQPAFQPFIPMNNYQLPALLAQLAEHGAERLLGRFTDHDGHLGVMLFFEKGRERG